MAIQVSDLERILASRGYVTVHETSKKKALRKQDSITVYVNRLSKNGVTSLIAHPSVRAHEIADTVPGAIVGAQYYHSSNMRLFPARMHRGKNAIPFGWGVTFDSERAAVGFIEALERAA